MRKLKMISVVLSLIVSQQAVAYERGEFFSEGSCSCKISWSCLARIDACSEEEAYQNAVSMCPPGMHAILVGEMQHEDCAASQGYICDLARAEFVCGW